MKPFLSANNISWKGILHDCNLQIHHGDCVVLVGKNGSGKSSLLRCLSGWNRIDHGTIDLQGSPIEKMTPVEKSRHLGLLPQQIHLFDNLPILEWLGNARFRFNESWKQSEQHIRSLLQTENLEPLLQRSWNQLSGGEKQRLALLGLKLQETNAWMLDEPGNHLDPKVQLEVYRSLSEAWCAGTTLVLVTHNINLLFQCFPESQWETIRTVGIDAGRILFDTPLNHPSLIQQIGDLYNLTATMTTLNEIPQILFTLEPS